MDPGGIEDVSGVREVFGPSGRTKASGITPSISMSDLVSHIGRCISGCGNPSAFPSGSVDDDDELNSRGILEEISRYLLNDPSSSNNIMVGASASATPLPDRHSLMCRVNSLYSLLQKDVHDEKEEEGIDLPSVRNPAWSRKDSVSDLLLLNLPRIASLPHILPVVSEECDGDKR